MAKRRHRMTSKRRAALRKAQVASARKRRGRFSGVKSAARSVGIVAGGIGATFLAYHTNEYIVHPSKFGRDAGIAVRNTKSVLGGASRKVTRRAPRRKAAAPAKDWSKFGYL